MAGLEAFVAYRQNPTTRARNRLTMQNAGLVHGVAHRFKHTCSVPFDDLVQIGFLGLIRAVETFDPSHGYAFSTFAVPHIRGGMQHYVRDRADMIKISRSLQALHCEGQRIRDRLIREGQPATDDAISLELGVTVEEWRKARIARAHREVVSLGAPILSDSDAPLMLSDTIVDPHCFKEDYSYIWEMVSQLEPKYGRAIAGVYRFDLSHKEVAKRMGISPMTVTRRIRRGVQQLAEVA